MTWLKNATKRGLLITLALMLISMVATGLIQTGSGSVKVKTLTIESISGHTMSAKLFIPANATADTPAPALVGAHGWYNSKENQEAFAVEFSRRGYVVLTYDMYSHGNSEKLDNVKTYDGGNGMYDAISYVATLPYVDADKIIAEGHSAGANAVSKAIVIDNKKGTNLIKGCILISYDPVIMEADGTVGNTFGVAQGSDGTYNNIYQNRDVAVIAGQYDDYFFTVKNGGKPVTATREYLSTYMAKAFVSFGAGPDAFAGDAVEEGKLYTSEIDGKTALRAIYTPPTIHAQTWYNRTAVADALTFANTVFAAPVQIEANNQVWQWKAIFGLLGLVAFWAFLPCFALWLIGLRPFQSLGESEKPIVIMRKTDKESKLWALGMTVVRVAASLFIIFTIMGSTMYSRIDPLFTQKNTFCISGWAALNALVILLTIVAWYLFYGKRNGFSLRDSGMLIKRENVLKTIAVAVLTIIAAWAVVFFADFFFQTDFRFWQWSVKVFGASELVYMIPFGVLFLLFYIVNSLSVNSLAYSDAYGKNETLNLVFQGFINALAPIIIIVIQYVGFTASGFQVWGAGYLARIPTWLHTSVIILFITPLIARKIYKRTNNPYLGGIINGLLVTLCMYLNSTTLLGTGL